MMSMAEFFYEGYICPVCNEKFNETDDIVVCPECGAPHHRACWMSTGICHYANEHGTRNQWKRSESVNTPPPSSEANNAEQGSKKVCQFCGQENLEFAEFCSRCGRPLQPSDWKSSQNHFGGNHRQPPPSHCGPGNPYREYSPVRVPANDPYGGLPRDEVLDGVTVEEFAAFIGPNSSHYLKHFRKISRSGSHMSWNWSAFLFTPFWLFYRKRFLAGSLVLLITIALSILSGYIYYQFIDPLLLTGSFNELSGILSSSEVMPYTAILALASIAEMLIRVIFGIIANSMYMRAARSEILKCKAKYPSASISDAVSADAVSLCRELGEVGGVSMALVAISAGIYWFSQMLMSLFLMAM